MTSSSHSIPSIKPSQSGIVAVELAFIIVVLIILFDFSVQLGRQFYWQQHFNNTADRLAKLLVLNIKTAGNIEPTSFNDALAIVQNQAELNDMDIGLSVYILSDDKAQENRFDAGSGCHENNEYPTTMQEITDIEAVDAVTRNAIPSRYLLGISLCVRPQNWTTLYDVTGLGELPLVSQSYYPINHKAFL